MSGKLWRQTGNSSLLPAKCWPLLHVIRACSWRWPDVVAGISARFSKFAFFCFVLLYNKSLNDWSLGKQWILFPLNLNVSGLDFVSGNIEISLFPSGPVITCLITLTSSTKDKIEQEWCLSTILTKKQWTILPIRAGWRLISDVLFVILTTIKRTWNAFSNVISKKQLQGIEKSCMCRLCCMHKQVNKNS